MMPNPRKIIEDEAKKHVKSLPIWNKLAYHLKPQNMPFIRKAFSGWRDRDAEYQRSGE